MATLKEVSDQIMKDLNGFERLPRFLGASLHSETLDRIFTKGVDSSGSSLGRYAKKTIKYKKEAGRFTSKKVNLRNTDTLANSWTWSFGKNWMELGFLAATRDGVTNDVLIPTLEDRYGKIFDLTSAEDKLIDDLTDDFINDLF